MVYTVKSNADFDKKLVEAGNKLVVVDFYASWCGPCKSIEPKVRALSKKYSDKAIVLKVNVEKFEEIANYYKVSSMPTFVFIRNKKKISGFAGADDIKLGMKMSNLIK